MSPIASARRPTGRREPAIAIEMGTIAPPPIACTARAAVSSSRFGASATIAEPARNTSVLTT
ncbi:hypothetical protein HRbin26_01900 [bacterium HR26]|nr:hypothetical protein HRbin26_01900 [bacterium HR26]